MIKFENCSTVKNPKSIIKEIDCKLVEYAKNHYNNISFMTKKKVPVNIIKDLIHYKRILTYKDCNENYLENIPVSLIYDKVMLKLHKK
jgi:hypothetical protein